MCSDLVVFYRDLMLLKTVEKPEQLIVALPEEMDDMKPLAQSFSLSRILYTLSVLQETQNRMSRTANRRTELEMSVVRICNPAMDSSAEAVLTRLEELEAAVRKGVSAVSSSFFGNGGGQIKKSGKTAARILATAPDSAIQTASEIKKQRYPYWRICPMHSLWQVAGGPWQIVENKSAVICGAEKF